MAQLKASVLEACERQGGGRVEVPSHAMVEPNGGAVLWAAMAVTAVRPGVDSPGDVNGDVTMK